MAQYFSGAVHQNINGSAERDRLDNALSNLANQMSNYSSTYNYYDYTSKDHGWAAQPPKNPSTGASESEYIKSFAREVAKAHRNDDIYVTHGEVWMIMDGFDLDYGYGATAGGVQVDLDGDGYKDSTIYPGRAAAMGHSSSADPLRVTNNILMQECGHHFNAGHGDGEYEFGSAGNIREATPMATAYVRAIDGNESDTCLAGGGHVPDSFCFGEDNKNNESYCGLCSNWCRHKKTLTSCTKSQIESNTPL